MTERAVPMPYSGTASVKPEWLDPNGHMNVAYYLSAFDDGSNVFFDDVGLGWDYTRSGQGSVFMTGCNLDFKREVLAGARLRITTRLLDWHPKVIHLYMCIHNEDEDYLAAVSEVMFMHVSLQSRRGTAMPATAQQRLAQVLSAHSTLARPAHLNRPLGIRR